MLVTTPKAHLKVFLLLSLLGIAGVFGCAKPSSNEENVSEQNRAQLSSNLKDATTQDIETEDEQAERWFNTPSNDGKIPLMIGENEIKVEYADTPQKRQLGLMFRRELCSDCGMLFKFDYARIGSIWMKNTYIPLDLAYIDKQGKIIDIKQLQAHDLTPVESSSQVLYALEMNLGWFAEQDIRVGDMVSLLP